MIRFEGNLSLSIIRRVFVFDNWNTLYSSVSSTLRRNSKERNMHILYSRSVDESGQAPLLSQRPGYREAKEQLRNLPKEKREQLALIITESERKRLFNKIDPSLQGYREWLSTNWAEHFAEKHHQPSSSSSWSPSSTRWSSSSWTSSWQRWHQHSWQDDLWSVQR